MTIRGFPITMSLIVISPLIYLIVFCYDCVTTNTTTTTTIPATTAATYFSATTSNGRCALI